MLSPNREGARLELEHVLKQLTPHELQCELSAFVEGRITGAVYYEHSTHCGCFYGTLAVCRFGEGMTEVGVAEQAIEIRDRYLHSSGGTSDLEDAIYPINPGEVPEKTEFGSIVVAMIRAELEERGFTPEA